MWQAECGPKCRTQKQSLTPKSCITLYFSILTKTKKYKSQNSAGIKNAENSEAKEKLRENTKYRSTLLERSLRK